uniref:Uncharacterized protein n=1 Tax=Trichogramma kaykai TaxID=54128 RepID=A0ABD2VX83_9HYME
MASTSFSKKRGTTVEARRAILARSRSSHNVALYVFFAETARDYPIRESVSIVTVSSVHYLYSNSAVHLYNMLYGIS